jgi:histidinol-phosphate aminotransferase
MNPAIKNLLRTHYIDLAGYVSAGMEIQKSPDKIFLNANENPYELPGLEDLNRYPEPQPPALRETYAAAYGVQADNIIMTRGADEAIVILTKIFCEPHEDAILICPPTFGMYAVDAHAMPAKTFEVPLVKEGGTFALDKTRIIKAATDDSQNIKLIFICSPNNPTGTALNPQDIRDICRETEERAIVVLDETYAEFAQAGSMCAELSAMPNLIILRTLSKSYAFAGMRMGCFISADNDFTALVRAKAMDAYPLPKLSIEAAFHVLSPEVSAVAKDNIGKILAERTRVQTALEASDQVTTIYPSDANFLLVEMKDANGFCAHCDENGLILRNFANKPLTENCLRISIGTPAENDKMLNLLERFQV